MVEPATVPEDLLFCTSLSLKLQFGGICQLVSSSEDLGATLLPKAEQLLQNQHWMHFEFHSNESEKSLQIHFR